jgi:hypothetical protein
MRQDFFLFIRIQIFDIHAAAIRTKKLSLTAGVITGCIQLGSHPPPAAFLTFFLVIAHTPALEHPMHGYAVLKPAFNAPSLREINLIFIIANIVPEGNSGMSSQK